MITVTPQNFADRDGAIARIQATGLHLAEAEMSQAELTGAPHSHAYDVDICVVEGVLELQEPELGLKHVLTAGSRALVPAGTLHAESCPARFHAVFGVSVDPVALMAERAAADASAG
jgi:quercetin dioxygenase-like cupin family protein